MAEFPNTEPVIAGFHPDPSICRVGGDYYLANSSFEYFPAVPILHSTDLVSWRQVGNVVTEPDRFTFGSGMGICAPTLRHHAGRFWLATTNVDDYLGGQVIHHADDPAGPWSARVNVREALGIDPDLAWDDDGRCVLTWAGLTGERGGSAIRQAEIDPLTGALRSEIRALDLPGERASQEGPHLYHVGEYWYLVTAEGGTDKGHCVCVYRGPTPSGPFEPAPHTPAFTHRSTDHPVQCTGHADLVTTPDGGWAAVYLGTRPTGTFPGFHVNGRETFLAGLTWDADGWPHFDETAYAVPPAAHSFTDPLTAPSLDARWISPRRDARTFTRGTPDGLELTAPDGPFPAIVATRARDASWHADVTLDASAGTGRLVLRMTDDYWAAIELTGGELRVVARVGGLHSVLASLADGDTGPRTVRVAVAGDAAAFSATGPDTIAFEVHTGGRRQRLATLDGRFLSTQVAGGMTGRVVGVEVTDGTVRARDFRYTAG